jgi:hypothetical protein
MDAGINNVICMELHSGPKMANGKCGKTIIAGTIDQGSTVIDQRMKDDICSIYKILHYNRPQSPSGRLEV